MKTSDFDYDLPESLIANYPTDKRTSSRLLVKTEKIEHKSFKDITKYFKEGDLLVLNNTSVIPARIYGNKESGGSVEILLERIIENNQALVQIRSGRAPKAGTIIILDSYEVKCIDREDNFFILQFDRPPLEIFTKIGHVPLPPYIKRHDEDLDKIKGSNINQDM